MDPNAQRSRGRAPDAGAYWQRRFFALVAGLGVIGLLAWACSGIVGGKPASQASGSGQVSAAAYGSAAPGQSAGGKSGAVSPATSAPAASPSPTTRATSSPQPVAPRRSAAPSAHRGTSKVRPGQPAAAIGACPAADIVLTLLASKPSYGPKEQPVFQIEVVSTDASACAFDAGRASLRVVISHGGQIAWNSAACLHGAVSHPTRLRRGVPATVSIGWDRHLTAPGCPATIMAASQRTYVAVAQSGPAGSPGQPFRLK